MYVCRTITSASFAYLRVDCSGIVVRRFCQTNSEQYSLSIFPVCQHHWLWCHGGCWCCNEHSSYNVMQWSLTQTHICINDVRVTYALDIHNNFVCKGLHCFGLVQKLIFAVIVVHTICWYSNCIKSSIWLLTVYQLAAKTSNNTEHAKSNPLLKPSQKMEDRQTLPQCTRQVTDV